MSNMNFSGSGASSCCVDLDVSRDSHRSTIVPFPHAIMQLNMHQLPSFPPRVCLARAILVLERFVKR